MTRNVLLVCRVRYSRVVYFVVSCERCVAVVRADLLTPSRRRVLEDRNSENRAKNAVEPNRLRRRGHMREASPPHDSVA